MKKKVSWILLTAAWVLSRGILWPLDARVEALAAKIKSVGLEGAGIAAASAASGEIAKLGPEALIDLLSAMDDAGPVAANWLRAGVDTISERALVDHRRLPAAELEAFVLERRHAGPSRRLAYEWLLKVDASVSTRLLPRWIDDPSVEMRRDAVAREIEAAQALLDKKDEGAARAAYRRLFSASRDPDQVEWIGKRLEALGETVDLTRHFGFLQEWKLIGPFDNSGKAGFDAVYPPEEKLDFDGEYQGKASKVRWVQHVTTDKRAIVDLNKALGKNMGAAAYAASSFESAVERPIHVRAGSTNAVKIWLNGKLLVRRDEYHHGMDMNQYVAPGTLSSGRNVILIKVCQNEGKEEWEQDWKFQLRVCDLTGGGIE